MTLEMSSRCMSVALEAKLKIFTVHVLSHAPVVGAVDILRTLSSGSLQLQGSAVLKTYTMATITIKKPGLCSSHMSPLANYLEVIREELAVVNGHVEGRPKLFSSCGSLACTLT